ncbi:MAG: hypothetical protein P8078_05515 [bacterium]
MSLHFTGSQGLPLTDANLKPRVVLSKGFQEVTLKGLVTLSG